RLNDWNTNPIRSRRSRASARSDMPARSIPSSVTDPDVGRSRPAAQCSSVDLPDPDGPITAVKLPLPKPSVTASSAVVAAPQVPVVLLPRPQGEYVAAPPPRPPRGAPGPGGPPPLRDGTPWAPRRTPAPAARTRPPAQESAPPVMCPETPCKTRAPISAAGD